MSAVLHYVPGASFLVVGPSVVILTTDEKLGRRLWPLIAEGAAGRTVLDAALRDGLTQLPDLVLIEFDGSQTRVLCRGTHTADVLTNDGKQSCSGKDVSTWAERIFTDADSGTVNNPVGVSLPIVVGIVRAGGFAWSVDRVVTEVEIETDAVAVPSVPFGTVEKSAADPKKFVSVHTVESAPEQVEDAPPAVPVNVAVAAETKRPSLAETRTEPTDDGFDHLFGSTVYRSVEDAAVREIVENPEPTPQPLSESATVPSDFGRAVALEPRQLGDHDGSTIMASELAALRLTSAQPTAVAPALSVEPAAAGAAITSVPRRTGPPPAILELSTGEQVSLDRGAVIGRRPQVDRVSGGAIPRLVTVQSPQQDISRSHLQITCEIDGYLATDLHSMNGTVVAGADGATETLGSGEQRQLRFGDVLDLGDGVTATFRAAP